MSEVLPVRVGIIVADLSIGGAERTVINWLRSIDRSKVAPTLYLLSKSGPFLSEVPPDVPIQSLAQACGTAGLLA